MLCVTECVQQGGACVHGDHGMCRLRLHTCVCVQNTPRCLPHQGLLVPDIPLEETPEIREIAEANGLELVLLTTPTTPKERMNAIAQNSQGFVYLVSITGMVLVKHVCPLVCILPLYTMNVLVCTGVTGAKEDVSGRVEGLVADLHDVTDKPVAVGFGVSKPEHVKKIVAWGAEGVIVGSALVRALGEAATPVRAS